MRALHLVMIALPTLLTARSAAAQGTGSVVATRVSITVPERAAPAPASRVQTLTAAARSGPVSTLGLVRESGHSDSADCSTSLEIAGIGVLSVSCLETPPSGGRSPGVSLELVAYASRGLVGVEWATLEIIADGGATMSLRARELVARGIDDGSATAVPRGIDDGSWTVVRGVRATLPAAAFARIAASRTLVLVAGPHRRVLTASEVRAWHALADTM